MDTLLLAVNGLIALLMAVGGFVIKRIVNEYDMQRGQIAALEKASADARVAAATLGEKLATEYVRADAIIDMKAEFRERCDRIDGRLEKIWEEMRRCGVRAS